MARGEGGARTSAKYGSVVSVTMKLSPAKLFDLTQKILITYSYQQNLERRGMKASLVIISNIILSISFILKIGLIYIMHVGDICYMFCGMILNHEGRCW